MYENCSSLILQSNSNSGDTVSYTNFLNTTPACGLTNEKF